MMPHYNILQSFTSPRAPLWVEALLPRLSRCQRSEEVILSLRTDLPKSLEELVLSILPLWPPMGQLCQYQDLVHPWACLSMALSYLFWYLVR